jgi:excisionase family DNA binding protein
MERGSHDLMTVEELSGHIRLHKDTIRRMVRNREIPFVRFGNARSHVYFRREAINAWLKDIEQAALINPFKRYRVGSR